LRKRDAVNVEDVGLEFIEVDTMSSSQESNDELEIIG
jgi:hypothetical protein